MRGPPGAGVGGGGGGAGGGGGWRGGGGGGGRGSARSETKTLLQSRADRAPCCAEKKHLRHVGDVNVM